MAEKPLFRDAYQKRRCLIPADAFYEWKREGRAKQPYRFALSCQEPMAMAGLWESWKAPDGSVLRTVCIITTEANEVMSPVHDRIPMILPRQAWEAWLAGPVEDALSHEAEPLQAEPVANVGMPPHHQLPIL